MIGDFKNPPKLIAYRVGVTVAQLHFMKRAAHPKGVFAYKPRTTSILEGRGIIGRVGSFWHLTSAGEALLRKAERIALMAVLEW